MMANDPYNIDLTRRTYTSDPDCDPQVSLSGVEAATIEMFWEHLKRQEMIIIPSVVISGMDKILFLLQSKD